MKKLITLFLFLPLLSTVAADNKITQLGETLTISETNYINALTNEPLGSGKILYSNLLESFKLFTLWPKGNPNQLSSNGVILNLKSGLKLTNLFLFQSNETSQAVVIFPSIGSGTNWFEILNSNGIPVIFVSTNNGGTFNVSNFIANGTLNVTGLQSNKNALHFIETGGGVDTISFIAPPSLASSLAFTLPNAHGNSGSVLTNDNAGNLGFWNINLTLANLQPSSDNLTNWSKLPTNQMASSYSLTINDLPIFPSVWRQLSGGKPLRFACMGDSIGDLTVNEITANISAIHGRNGAAVYGANYLGVTTNTTSTNVFQSTNWFNSYWNLASGGNIDVSNFFTIWTYADRLGVEFLSQTNGGTFKLQLRTNGGAYTDVLTGIATGTTNGGAIGGLPFGNFTNVAMIPGYYDARVVHTGVGGLVSIIGVDLYSTNSPGVRISYLNRGGSTVQEMTNVSISIAGPILRSLELDLLTIEGTTDATADAYTAYSNLYQKAFITLTNTDILFLGTTPVDPIYAFDFATYNAAMKKVADENGRFFIDQSIISGSFSNMQFYGWAGDGLHRSNNLSRACASKVMQRMGLLDSTIDNEGRLLQRTNVWTGINHYSNQVNIAGSLGNLTISDQNAPYNQPKPHQLKIYTSGNVTHIGYKDVGWAFEGYGMQFRGGYGPSPLPEPAGAPLGHADYPWLLSGSNSADYGTFTFFSGNTNKTNIVISQRIGQAVPVLSFRSSNNAPIIEIDNRGFLIITNSLTNRVASPTNTIAIGVADYGGFSFPRWTDSHQLDFTIQPSLAHESTYWLNTAAGAIPGAEGVLPTTNGGTTISHTTPIESQPFMVALDTPASSNGCASIFSSVDIANSGALNGSSKVAGYFYAATWCSTNLIAQVEGGGAPRTFVGLTAKAAEDYTNLVVTSNSTGQYIGLMCDAKQSTNMYISARDSGNEFRTNTGIPFIATNVYKFYLFNSPSNRFAGWRLDDTYAGTSAFGWFTNNVPTNFMKFGLATKNGTNRAHSIRYSRLYLQAPLIPPR